MPRASHSEVIRPTDPRIGTLTGQLEDGVIRVRHSNAGFALYGGYLTLPPGRYRAIVWLSTADPLSGTGRIDVCGNFARVSLAEAAFDTQTLSKANPFIDLSFHLERNFENIEIRLRAVTDLSLAVTGIEVIDLDWRTFAKGVQACRDENGRRPLNILYSAVHIILEYDELRMLTDLGHRVFSFNHAYSQPNDGNILRPSMPQFFHPGDWDRFKKEGLSPGFLADFDVIIVSGTPHRVPEFLDAIGDMPLIYRSIGQMSPGCEDMLKPVADRITTVRYSERERGLPDILSADEVIYFGKYRSDFAGGWIGGGGILTFHNSYPSRFQDSIPNPDIYREFAAAWPCDLYGVENQDMPNSRGVAAPAEQFDLYRNASLYLYVYTVGPSYSLSFIEAMGSGVPILAPTIEFIRKTGLTHIAAAASFTPERYEVADLLENDPRMLYSSTEEAHAKIGWLRANPDYCRMVSDRQRARFAEVFDAEKISSQWNELLYRLVPAARTDRTQESGATCRIGFAYDLFRSPALDQWDAAPQARWLQEFMTPALAAAGARVHAAFDHDATKIASWVTEQITEGNLPAGTPGWCELYSAQQHRDRLTRMFAPMLAYDLIVGYELSPNQIRFLVDHGKLLVDVRIGGPRCCKEAFFSVRTNHPPLAAALQQFHIGSDLLLPAVGFLRAQLSRRYAGATGPGRDLVVVGQVDVDTSLVSESRIGRLVGFLPELTNLMATHERMVLQPHPLARRNTDIAELLLTFPQAALGRGSVYEAVCSPRTRTVVTLSSSVADEAELLGKRVVRLLRPDISPEALATYLCPETCRVDHVIASGPFWQALLSTLSGRFFEVPRSPATGRVPELDMLKTALGIYCTDPMSHLPDRAVQVGTTIHFSSQENVCAHCTLGWSTAQPSGVWSTSPIAVLSFDCEDMPATLELTLSAFIGCQNRVLDLELTLAGEFGSFQVRQNRRFLDGDEHVLTIALPQYASKRHYDLCLRMESPVSPLALGVGDDPRELGVLLRQLRLIA